MERKEVENSVGDAGLLQSGLISRFLRQSKKFVWINLQISRETQFCLELKSSSNPFNDKVCFSSNLSSLVESINWFAIDQRDMKFWTEYHWSNFECELRNSLNKHPRKSESKFERIKRDHNGLGESFEDFSSFQVICVDKIAAAQQQKHQATRGIS